MPPIPCAHCGINFMRIDSDPKRPKLCNSCLLKEERRNPTQKVTMDTIEIVIKCPRDVQIEIEEYCINKGIDFSKYFLSLHHFFNKPQEKSEFSHENTETSEQNYHKPRKNKK